MHVGALCREMTNKAVAELEHLHDSTVKDLDSPDNKISLGLVEGLNNKIRVIQRRAYGLPKRGVPAPQDHRRVPTPAASKGWRRPTVIREDPKK